MVNTIENMKSQNNKKILYFGIASIALLGIAGILMYASVIAGGGLILLAIASILLTILIAYSAVKIISDRKILNALEVAEQIKGIEFDELEIKLYSTKDELKKLFEGVSFTKKSIDNTQHNLENDLNYEGNKYEAIQDPSQFIFNDNTMKSAQILGIKIKENQIANLEKDLELLYPINPQNEGKIIELNNILNLYKSRISTIEKQVGEILSKYNEGEKKYFGALDAQETNAYNEWILKEAPGQENDIIPVDQIKTNGDIFKDHKNLLINKTKYKTKNAEALKKLEVENVKLGEFNTKIQAVQQYTDLLNDTTEAASNIDKKLYISPGILKTRDNLQEEITKLRDDIAKLRNSKDKLPDEINGGIKTVNNYFKFASGVSKLFGIKKWLGIASERTEALGVLNLVFDGISSVASSNLEDDRKNDFDNKDNESINSYYSADTSISSSDSENGSRSRSNSTSSEETIIEMDMPEIKVIQGGDINTSNSSTLSNATIIENPNGASQQNNL